jgi:hypothetical protein
VHVLRAENGHECDLWAAPTNVRSWESNGLNADVAFGPFMTQTGVERQPTDDLTKIELVDLVQAAAEVA